MAVVETAQIRLEGDTEDFQRSWSDVLKTMAKVTTAAATTAAGVIALGKAFRQPTEAFDDVAKLGGAAAKTFKAVGGEAAGAFEKISAGAPVLAVMAKSLGSIGAQLGALVRSLATTAKAWFDEGLAAMGFTKQLDESRKALQSTGEAIEDLGGKAEENGKIWKALGALIGQAILGAFSRLAASISDTLNPELSGLAANVGAVSQASRDLQRVTTDLATAFEAGRQRAILPVENALSRLIPSVGATGKAMAELTGQFSTYASAGLKVVSVATSWAATLAGVGAAIGALQGVLDVGPVREYAERLLGVENVAKGLTGILAGLWTLIKSGLTTAFGEMSTAIQVGLRMAINPWTISIGIATVALAALAAAVLKSKAEAALLNEEQERSSKHFRDARDQMTAYAQDVKFLSKVEADFTLSIKGAVEQLALQTENLKAQTASAQGLGSLAVQYRRQAQAIQDSVEWQQRRQQLEEQEKNVSREIFETRKAQLDIAEREYNRQKLISDQLEDTRSQIEAGVAAVERRNAATLLAFEKERNQIALRREGLNAERQLLDGLVALGATREQTEAQRLALLEREEAAQRAQLELAVKEAKNAQEQALAKAKVAVAAEKLVRFAGMNLRLADDLTTEAKRYTEEWQAAVRQLDLFNSGLSEALRKQQALQVQWGTVEDTLQKMRDDADQNYEQVRTKLEGQLSLIQAQAQAYAANRAGQAETEESLKVQNGFLEQMRSKRLELNAAEKTHLENIQAVLNEEKNQALVNGLGDDKIREIDNALADIGTRLKANADSAKVIATEVIRITDTQKFALTSRELDRRLELERSSLNITQEKLSAQESILNSESEIAGLIVNDNERAKASIEIEMRRLALRRQQAVALRGELEAERGLMQQRLDEVQKLDAANQTRVEEEPRLQKQIQLVNAQLEAQNVQMEGLVTSAEVLRQKFQDIGTTILPLGDTFAETATAFIEAAGRSTRDMKQVFDGFKDTIVGTFKSAFSNALAEKLRFDLKFKTNFLEDLPGIARQGVGLIGQAFSALGNMGGGATGTNWLGTIGTALQGFGTGGAGAAQTGGGNWLSLLSGVGGGGGGGSNISNLLSIGQSAASGAKTVAGWFGGGLGGGTTAAGGLVPAGVSVVGPETALTAAEAQIMFPAGAAGPTPVPASFGGPSVSSGGAAGGLGSMASTAAIMFAVVAALESLAAGLGAEKQRLNFYNYNQVTKAVGEGFDPITKALGNVISYVGTGHSGKDLQKSTLDALGGQGSVHDYIKTAMYAILNPMLFNLSFWLKDLPTKGTVMRKQAEEYVENKDLGAGFFARDSGTFIRGIGQTGALGDRGDQVTRDAADVIGGGMRQIMKEQGLDVAPALRTFSTKMEDFIGLTREQGRMFTAFSVIFRAMQGKQAGNEEQRAIATKADTLGSIVAEGASKDEAVDIAQTLVSGMGRPAKFFAKLNEFYTSKNNDIALQDYRDAIQGAATALFTDLPAGVNAAQIALEELNKTGTVTFEQLERRITAAAQSASLIGTSFRTAMDETRGGTDKAVVKQDFYNNLKSNITETVLSGFETAFLEVAVKGGLLEPFYATMRKAFEQLESSPHSAEDLKNATDQIRDAGKTAIESLKDLDPILEQAITSTKELADAFGTLGGRVPTVGELVTSFGQSLKQGLEEVLKTGLSAAFAAPTVEVGMKSLTTAFGSFLQESVAGALIQAFVQSSAIKSILAPLQTVLATAMAEAVAGGITSGTMAGVGQAVTLTAQSFSQVMEQMRPLFEMIFGQLKNIGGTFGGATAAQQAEQYALQQRITKLQRERQLIQESAQVRIDALTREVELAQKYDQIKQGAQSAIEQIQSSEQGGLTVYEQLALTRKRVDTELTKFRDPGSSIEQKQAAADKLFEYLPLLLSQGNAAYQLPSNQAKALRDFVMDALEEIRKFGADGSKGLEEKQQELVDLTKATNGILGILQRQSDYANRQLEALNDKIAKQQGTVEASSPYYVAPDQRDALQQMLMGLSKTGDTIRRLGVLGDLSNITTGGEAAHMANAEVKRLGLTGEAAQNEINQTLYLFNSIRGIFSNIGTDAAAFQKVVAELINKILHPDQWSDILHFDKGGWVPGQRGEPQLAVVHGQEYVVSDPRKLPIYRPWTQSSPASGGTHATSYSINAPITVHVPAGTTINEAALARRITEQLERGARMGRFRRVLQTSRVS